MSRQVEDLKLLLATEYVLYVNTQSLHWNVTGMAFGSLHELFRQQYVQLAEFIDLTAEQIRKYGEAAPGSLSEFLSTSRVEELRGGLVGQRDAVNAAYQDNLTLINLIQSFDPNDYDLATQGLLTDLLDAHLKNAWMLRAHLE